MRERVLFTWSGGKDSAMALYELRRTGGYEVAALLTTVTEDYGRVSMHGVRSALLDRQAGSLALPLEKVHITKESGNIEYEEKMGEALARYRRGGVLSVAFGDIFLEDLRRYRESKLSKAGMKGLFPLWKMDTAGLAREFISLGFKAVVTCVDSDVLEGRFAGRDYDEGFLAELPPSVDPCGENGEFHSFVYDGPIFRDRIGFEKGEVVLRDKRYYFCDLMPA
jgi:uncharacterized protein (TIGR00290 family)